MGKVEINKSKTIATISLGLNCDGDEQFDQVVIISYDDKNKTGIGHDSNGYAVRFDDENFSYANEDDEWENISEQITFICSYAYEWLNTVEEDEEEEIED